MCAKKGKSPTSPTSHSILLKTKSKSEVAIASLAYTLGTYPPLGSRLAYRTIAQEASFHREAVNAVRVRPLSAAPGEYALRLVNCVADAPISAQNWRAGTDPRYTIERAV